MVWIVLCYLYRYHYHLPKLNGVYIFWKITQMISPQMYRRAVQMQMYNATKQLFLAVAEKKSIILYGPPGSGKTYLMNQYSSMLNDHTRVYTDLHSKKCLRSIIGREGLFIAESIYHGDRKLNIPREDIAEIFLPMKYIA